jgi:hypothetical protein
MFPSNQNWPLALALDVPPVQYRYTPRSDFCIVLNDLPVLLLEVNSQRSEGDDCRMLLQAASVVRLVNAFLCDKSPDFVVKAIYIGENFIAIEYTVFQTEKVPTIPARRVINLLIP